jgi:arylsulfatase A
MSQIDLFATIAGLLEIEIPEGNAEDSLDQRRMVFGTGESSRETLVHNTNPKGYAIRQGVWLLIESDSGSVSKVPEWFDRENGYRQDQMPGELYRLDVDLGQRENLYGLHADLQGGKVQAMQQELQRILNAKQ